MLWRVGGDDETIVEIGFEPNYNEGRPEIHFALNVEGHPKIDRVFSIQGMMKRVPRDHRAAILEICREELQAARMHGEHLRVLERAISRAEQA